MAEQKKEDAVEKPITSVMEDYLEAIFELYMDKDVKVIRVRDIAKKLNVKMPTVTSMLRVLNDRDLVDYEKYEYVALTRRGKGVGREIKKRHRILQTFLSDVLDIDRKTADQEACRMEHALSAITMESLTAFMEFIQVCPRAGNDWVARFQAYKRQGHIPDACLNNNENYACESGNMKNISGKCCMEEKK
jgi:DtxR family transcriptional regulator, Mn-dependent transcriptional regulator